MGLWLQPREQTAVVSVKRKHSVHAWRRQIRSAWPGVSSLFLFACLLFVFQLSTLCPAVMSCKLPRKTFVHHRASTQFTWRRQEAFGHVYTTMPPKTNLNSYSVILFPKTKLKWCCFVCLKNKMHPKCGNANDKNWNSTERSKCSRRLRYFHYTSLISVRTYCDFTC